MRLRAIVIDDDENCRKLLSLVLERKGYEVISLAEPGACPLYMEPECNCPSDFACGDFLITDNRMPRMSGLEFVEHQSRRGCKGISRNKLVVSGTWSPEELKKAEQLGCKVLQKPYDLNQVLSWLKIREQLIPASRMLTSATAFSG